MASSFVFPSLSFLDVQAAMLNPSIQKRIVFMDMIFCCSQSAFEAFFEAKVILSPLYPCHTVSFFYRAHVWEVLESAGLGLPRYERSLISFMASGVFRERLFMHLFSLLRRYQAQGRH